MDVIEEKYRKIESLCFDRGVFKKCKDLLQLLKRSPIK